jgi:hypothetical protein
MPDYPRAIAILDLRTASIVIENDLNQPVVIRVKAGRLQSTTGMVDVGSAITVAGNATDARTLTPDTSGWLPFITVSAQCPTAPTAGTLTVWRVRSKDDQVKLVDALAIRNTLVHDASTDPANVFIVEW